MKSNTLLLLLTIIEISACKKQVINPGTTSSLTIVNAVVGSKPLVTNFSSSDTLPNYYRNALRLNYGGWNINNQLGAYSGNQSLRLYQYPDTLEHSSPLFNLTLDLPSHSIHSLFLTGTVSSPDTLFTTDKLPYHPASDSSIGIRFINLSPGSSAISINISGYNNGSEVNNLNYKGVTGFKNYAATAAVDSYTFEIRDATTGDIISDYTLSGVNNGAIGINTDQNEFRYRDITLALIGAPGSQRVLFIRNY